MALRKLEDEPTLQGLSARELRAVELLARGGELGVNRDERPSRFGVRLDLEHGHLEEQLTAGELLRLVQLGVLQVRTNPDLPAVWDGWEVERALLTMDGPEGRALKITPVAQLQATLQTFGTSVADASRAMAEFNRVTSAVARAMARTGSGVEE